MWDANCQEHIQETPLRILENDQIIFKDSPILYWQYMI